MAKGKKLDKMSAADKRKLFWEAIMSQRNRDLREGLTITGIEAQTRNEEGLTSFQVAAASNKPKSLEMLIDWYQRRKILRQKGWVNLRDENGKTALMLACERGNLECVETLILSDCGVRIDFKDSNGKTAIDYAKSSKRKDMAEKLEALLKEESEDEAPIEIDGENVEGLTTTQRNKLKKKKLRELERGNNAAVQSTTEKSKGERIDMRKIPKPLWPEVAAIIESIEMLRELKEVAVERESVDSNQANSVEGCPVDPALWHLIGVNRLTLKLASASLSSFPRKTLSNLLHLHTLILNHNGLTSLPEDISCLQELKSLEVSYNQLETIPQSLSKCKNLELVNVEQNKLTSVKFLHGLEKLVTLNFSNNNVVDFDLDFEKKTRLKIVSGSFNQISEVSNRIVFMEQLSEVVLESNELKEIPKEICQLKKIKVLKLGGNKLKDQKVVKMLKQEGKLKDLWKYLKKIGGQDSIVEPFNYSSEQEEEEETNTITEEPVGDGEESDSSWDSSCSFDITFEEL